MMALFLPQSPTSLSPPTSPLTSQPTTLTSHFVQALHDYLPSSSATDESVSCLFFKKGSIIEVFNRDDSGWWDGQCGDIRGWFPSNYVGRIGELKRQSADFEDDYSNEEIELWYQKHHVSPQTDPSVVSLDEYNTKLSTIESPVEMPRALLNEDRRRSNDTAIEEEQMEEESQSSATCMEEVSQRVSDLVDACTSNQLHQSQIQLNVYQVISAVRSVLTDANIVNKESPVLRTYPELARQRKTVLSALSRLVLKGKELQQLDYNQQNPEHQDDQISYLADQLLIEMEIFEKILVSITKQSASSSVDSDNTTRTSSMFQYDTPRSSISSLGHSSVVSTNSIFLRQIISESRHNNTSSFIIPNSLPIYAEQILQNVLDHQANIDELMANLVITLERYLVNRHRATEMLETTRKAVEAVRTFLAIVEHVCSNLGDIDYNRRLSMIPEDPRLVSLVITKESVYSAITNLVTAVRVLTGSQQEDSSEEEDLNHLPRCCEKVVQTTNECAACVCACIQAEDMMGDTKSQDMQQHQHQLHLQQEQRAENSAGSQHTLSALGRKVTSLHAIQKYRDEKENHVQAEEKVETSEQDIEELAIEATSISMNNEANAATRRLSIGNEDLIAHKSSRASLQINTAVMTIVPPPEDQPRRLKMRARAASVNNVQSLIHLSNQLPPLPPKNNKPSMAAVFPLPPASIFNSGETSPSIEAPPKSSRRPRGLSVSSLRTSINKSKTERLSASNSTESLPEPLRLQKLPSWMSISSAPDRSENISQQTETVNVPLVKKEAEFEFLKQYVFTDDEMIFNAEGEVTGATVEALIKKLTLHEKSPDLIFTRTFFYTFRLFTNPSDFVKFLVRRFNLSPPSNLAEEQIPLWTNRVLIPIRLRVYNVIKTWMETYFSFEQDAIVEKDLMGFASNDMSLAMPSPAKRMVELIARTFASKGLSSKHSYNEIRVGMQRSNSSNVQLQSSASTNNGNIFSNLTLFDGHNQHDDDKYPPSIMGKSLRNTLRKAVSTTSLTAIHVNDVDPVELARQITIMENDLFCRIRSNEMIGQEFKKKVGTSQAIHVKAMIQRSTQITSWVSDTILSESDAKKRAHVLKYWIKVGDACLQLNNYNTLMAIRSALDSTSIARLKKTWDYVSGKYKAMWEPIYRATDSQRNFAEYRQRLKTTVAPCLPFLGVYLTDMTFIDDGNADRRMSPGGQPLINFDKYVKITRILNEIDQFQISYRLIEVEEIQNYLKKTLESIELDDQVFYARSLKREPKDEE